MEDQQMSHLKRVIRIHAPLDSVFNLTHDPNHWSDWYVGLSDAAEIETEAASKQHRQLMVGTPFPLTQRVVEDRLGKTEAHLLAKAEGSCKCFDVSRLCKLIMLTGDCEWIYKQSSDSTEVTVVLDFALPTRLLDDASDREVVERLEAECLERSLENLRTLCETSH